jgi:hypothetical protein
MFNKILLPAFFCLSLLFPFSAFAEKYSYDYNDPVSLVKAASKMIMDGSYSDMMLITEGPEQKRTLDVVTNLQNNIPLQEKIKKESQKITGFEVLSVEIYTNDSTNHMSVVSTRWLIKIDNANPKNPKDFVRIDESKDPNRAKRSKIESDVYVDYLLKKYENKWKIVSKRTR